MPLVGPMIAVLVLARPSCNVVAAPVALQVRDLPDPAQAARVVAVLVAPVVPAVLVVVPALVAAVVVPVEAPLVRLDAVVARASRASPSARSVKSLKCGRRQAWVECKFPVVMAPRLSAFVKVHRSVILPKK